MGGGGGGAPGRAPIHFHAVFRDHLGRLPCLGNPGSTTVNVTDPQLKGFFFQVNKLQSGANKPKLHTIPQLIRVFHDK